MSPEPNNTPLRVNRYFYMHASCFIDMLLGSGLKVKHRKLLEEPKTQHQFHNQVFRHLAFTSLPGELVTDREMKTAANIASLNALSVYGRQETCRGFVPHTHTHK